MLNKTHQNIMIRVYVKFSFLVNSSDFNDDTGPGKISTTIFISFLILYS